MIVALATILITADTCLGSYYARRFKKPDGLIALYVLFVALSQIIAGKIAVFNLGFSTVTAPAAVLIFAVTFLITDIVNERFGRRAVHHMIFLTLVTQIIMVGFLYLGTSLEPAPFWEHQEAWSTLFGVVPRITIASWLTFLVSENLDAVLFTVVKKITGGRHLWARNVFSSAPALTVDTLLFVSLAFAGTGLPLGEIMIGQFVMKYIVCLVDIPFMYLNRWILGPSTEQGL